MAPTVGRWNSRSYYIQATGESESLGGTFVKQPDEEEESVPLKMEEFYSYEHFTAMHVKLTKIESEMAELKRKT